MSTRTSKILIEDGNIQIHIYHEMHDDCIHLELCRLHEGKETNESVNLVLSPSIAKDLIRILNYVFPLGRSWNKIE